MEITVGASSVMRRERSALGLVVLGGLEIVQVLLGENDGEIRSEEHTYEL